MDIHLGQKIMRALINTEVEQVQGGIAVEMAAFGATSGFITGLGFAGLLASGEILTNSLIIGSWTMIGVVIGIL